MMPYGAATMRPAVPMPPVASAARVLERGAHGGGNPRAMLGSAQIMSDLELNPSLARTAVAHVLRMPARIRVAVGNHVEPRERQPTRHAGGQGKVEAAYENLRATAAAVDAEDGLVTGCEGEAIRMIETMTGDVQGTAAAVGLQAFEAKQAVIRSGDQYGNLGGSHFDLSAVRGDDERRRTGSVDPDDSKVASRRLELRQLGE